jgi:hypothetical protein
MADTPPSQQNGALAKRDDHIPASTFFPKVTHVKKSALLGAFLEIGALNKACAMVGLDHSHHYYWMRTDPDYADAFTEAKVMVATTLEEEAIRRAREGVTRAVYHQGEVVGEQQHYSDTLMIFLLKGMMPDKYGNAHVDRQDKQSISDLLKAVLLEMSARQQVKDVTPEADWAPLAAAEPPPPPRTLPAPPDPQER